MAWRFNGRARVSRTNPQAQAICDRCCFRYNLADLRFQHDWRGNKLQNLYIRVCQACYDKPQQQFRPIIVPPDPVPVRMPRPDLYAPLLPVLMTAINGEQLTDTAGATLTATDALPPSATSNAGSTVTGITTAEAIDGYETTAPDGGPVILIPD